MEKISSQKRHQIEVDTAASILHGVKIVQIHNINNKKARENLCSESVQF
jgi:hypothetical protein